MEPAEPYSLVDTDTGNLVGSYESEQAALRDVAACVMEYGADSPEVRSLALIRHDAPAASGGVAAGPALAARAVAQAGESSRSISTVG